MILHTSPCVMKVDGFDADVRVEGPENPENPDIPDIPDNHCNPDNPDKPDNAYDADKVDNPDNLDTLDNPVPWDPVKSGLSETVRHHFFVPWSEERPSSCRK